jgi:hypothetical protein
MDRPSDQKTIENLPQSAQEFIKLVIKKMRYRRSVRRDVEAELAAHFEDELRNCSDEQQKQQRAQQLIEQFGDPKLLGILLSRAKKRCRPLWRTIVARFFQAVGILILCFAIYVVWFLSGKPAVTTDYLAELNRAVRPTADDSQNAAPLFDEAAAACPNMPDRGAAFSSHSYIDVNDAEKKIIADYVTQCSASLQLIAHGVERPYYWRKYENGKRSGNDGSMMGILMPHLLDFRNLARAFCYRAPIRAAKGQYSEAFDDLVTCYKFGRLIGQGEKMLIEQLVGIAIDTLAISNTRTILAEHELNSRQLAALQDAFSKAQAGQEFRMRLLFEKFCIYDEIQRCFTDGFGGGHLYPKRMLSLSEVNGENIGITEIVLGTLITPKNWGYAARFMFTNPNKAETKQQAGAFYDFIEQTSKMTPAELREKKIDLDKQAESITQGNIFLRMLIPELTALSKVHQISYRLKADAESLPVIIAALRFKADKARYPNDLTELQQAGYIKEIPIDPFSNKPLVYRQTENGFILYSVGYNFKDDGGVLGTDSKGNKKVWADEGDAAFWPVQK